MTDMKLPGVSICARCESGRSGMLCCSRGLGAMRRRVGWSIDPLLLMIADGSEA